MTDADNLIGLHIRQAQITEADDLTRLAMESKAHWNYTAEQLALWRSELTVPHEVIAAGRAYVGEIDHTLAAMMVLSPAAMTWKLNYFFVGPAWMNRGIGKTMFQFAIEMARKQGARAVSIDADPNAEPFYLLCGAIRSHTINAPIAEDSNRIRPQMLFAIPTKKAGLPD
ncbi:GNAT family N-acetyltransferase [Solimicrobium silvestre]|uniref:Acetyltransferase (GNAT) domain n=1 Tax=Solimicrobium silvestre TaxID=2099400 RepID=A0A2S9H0I3_9BURK|nr:GNAT family N-acetyltransferase [Solimicrobium silvestre]PRC93492.1 Acetyltransferase (GNAT) domain [Solimicrobium silvestre]